MGRADDVVERDQRRVLCRLLLEDVQGGAGHLAGDEGVVEVLLADDPAPGAVDDVDALFHLGEGGRIDQSPGLLRHGGVDRDDIGLREDFVEADQGDPHLLRRLRGDERVVGDDLHLQSLGPVGDDAADPADADDPEGLVEELVPGEFALFPLAGLHGCRRLGDLPDQGEHHGDRVLAGGDGVAAGGVHHDDAPLAGRRDVHVVEADARAADDGQFPGAIDHLLGDLGRAPDDQAVVLLDDRLEFIGGHLRPDVDFDPRRLFEYFDSFGGQAVADQYSSS